jgi:hypothetical protein
MSDARDRESWLSPASKDEAAYEKLKEQDFAPG